MSCKQNLKLDVDIKTIQKILVDYGGGVFDIASRWGYDTRGVLQLTGWVYLHGLQLLWTHSVTDSNLYLSVSKETNKLHFCCPVWISSITL